MSHKERDVAKREAIFHKIQYLTIERAMFLPIMDYRTLRGVGPRVAEHALDSMPLNPLPFYTGSRDKEAVCERVTVDSPSS